MTSLPPDDAERFDLITGSLYTAVIGDVLDSLGRTRQFLPAAVRALQPSMRIAGRAMPVLVADVMGVQARPFGRLTDALDSLAPGDVYLARRGRSECAAWGEIMTAAARARGAAGAVLDGYHRDTRAVLAQDFPVFSRGSFGQDAGVRASVLDFGVPIDIDGVGIRPGDLLVGDIDGVLAVPADIEEEVLELALVKTGAENVVRRAIENGMTTAEAYATYGVL